AGGDEIQGGRYGGRGFVGAVFEWERAASHQRFRPSAAMPQQAGRIRFALDQAVDRDGFRFRAVEEGVSVPMRNDHQIATRQGRRLLGAFYSEPRPSALDNVEMGISARR